MELHERLRTARKRLFDTAAEAADALGVPYGTYAGHENGSSGFRNDKGEMYARRFKVRFDWLMREFGPMTDDSPAMEEFLTLVPRAEPEAVATALYVLRQGQKPAESQQPSAETSRQQKATRR